MVTLSIITKRTGVDRSEASQTIECNNFLFRGLRKFPNTRYGLVWKAAKPAGCKPVTLETSKVRVLPGPPKTWELGSISNRLQGAYP